MIPTVEEPDPITLWSARSGDPLVEHHVMFGFNLLTQLRSQIMLARRLVARGWRVTFLFTDESQNASVARARKEIGDLAPLVCLEEFPGEGEPRLNPTRTHPFPLRAFAAAIYCRSRRAAFANYREEHRRILARALAALTQLAPSALIYAEDGVAVNFRLLAVAKDLGIPIIDLPYAFSWRDRFHSRLRERHDAGKLHVATGRDLWALRVLAPQWLATPDLPGGVYFAPGSILSLEAMRVSLEDPTTLMDGYVDVICVESEAMRGHYVSEGVPRFKMEMTGAIYCDEILGSLARDERARAAFRQPRFIDPVRPRLLISWSLDRHADRARYNEFPTYKDMTLSFFGRLGELRERRGLDVTISLSPNNTPPEAATWIEEAGFPVTKENIMTLIGRHDLFVASSSSTRRWAFACGKPVVSYDTYGLEHNKMSGAGFLSSTRLDEVIAHIDRLTKSEEAYRALAAPQCAEAESWGVIDGHCADRIIQTIARAIENASESQARRDDIKPSM